MRLIVKLVSFVALALSVLWVINKPGFDSAVAVAAALAALLSSFFLGKEKTTPGHAQHVSANSTGIQAGRDAKVDSFKRH